MQRTECCKPRCAGRRSPVILVVALLIAATACTSETVVLPTSSLTLLPTGPTYQMTEHAFVLENSSGVRLRLTLSIGTWLRGSDTTGLDNAWYQVSGGAGMPLGAGTYMSDANHDPMELEPDTAAYLFGTVFFENLTTDRDADDFLNVLHPPGVKGPSSDPGSLMIPLYGVGFSTTVWEDTGSFGGTLFVCYQGSCTHTWGDVTHFSIAAPFSGANRSGPHPIAIAFPNVFGPDFPDGAPDFSRYVFRVETFGQAVDGRIDPHPDDRFPSVGPDIPTQIGWIQP